MCASPDRTPAGRLFPAQSRACASPCSRSPCSSHTRRRCRAAARTRPGSDLDAVQWHVSRSLGKPYQARALVDGVQLPELGQDYFTWDPVYNRIPNRGWRRWGTDRLVRTAADRDRPYRAERSSAQRVGIMDLSREHGGPFGREYGGLGHASHQNGLDADVLYPRKDGQETRAIKPSEVDQMAAQDLLDRFVAAGAVKVFVGPHLTPARPQEDRRAADLPRRPHARADQVRTPASRLTSDLARAHVAGHGLVRERHGKQLAAQQSTTICAPAARPRRSPMWRPRPGRPETTSPCSDSVIVSSMSPSRSSVQRRASVCDAAPARPRRTR